MNKKIIIILSCIVSAVVLASIVVLFIYPGLLRGPKVIIDERTGKTFDVVDGKVQVYLPVKITSYQNGTSVDDYDIEVKYDNKARITEKNVQGHNLVNEAYSRRTSFTYDIDGRLKHISDSRQGNDFVDDWNFEYKDDYVKSVSKEEKSKQRDVESYLTSPYIYYEYNSNGLLIDYYSSNSNYNNGEKTQRSLHTIQYDDNGIMKSLEMSEEFSSYNIDFLYDNGLIKETVLEGKSSDEYWYNKTEYSRENNRITKIDSSDISWGMTTNETSSFTYENDLLIKVESESEFSSDSNNNKSSVIVELNYDNDKKIKEVSYWSSVKI